MHGQELWRLGAVEARRLLGPEGLASGRLWDACRERIVARDPAISAFLRVNPSRGPFPASGPATGIPVGIKDIIDTIDMATEYGSPIYAGHRPPRDAWVVAGLRMAGGVIAGKTATTEFAGPNATITRNPHDLTASPGGSSAGSAAAVASGMIPLALGTQTAGSIIRPAAFCGVVGFKPSFGEIDTLGIRPACTSLDTVGIFSRSVEDAAWLWALLARRPAVPDMPAASLHIGLWRPAEMDKASASVQSALEAAANALSRAGHRVVDLALPPAFVHAESAARIILEAETYRSTASELLHAPDQISSTLLDVVMAGSRIEAGILDQARRTIARAEREFAQLVEETDVDVVITPAAADEAPADPSWTGDAVFNRIWTAISAPAITLPQCYGERSLPIGLQLVLPRSRDQALIHAATVIDRILLASADAPPRIC
ncbi:amidase [Paracoccus sp. MBLB3053]|uniref:Amidase n=1 Tax=Paracoccus aurantius TaxID=3073814 RepID=A0ABU2HVW2_9RHOB|nr:amidase [Paracoccus sp. MBLB3053]MDS9469180.1 amidase [Paracoccus sp. MBLB3053]